MCRDFLFRSLIGKEKEQYLLSGDKRACQIFPYKAKTILIMPNYKKKGEKKRQEEKLLDSS